MLSALRPPEHANPSARYASISASAVHSRVPTDPSELPPDRLHVEMEMSPDSQIILYGPLLRAIISIKVESFALTPSPTRKCRAWFCDVLNKLRPFIHPSRQENYFGEDDMFTDFEEAVSSPVLSTSTSSGLGWSPLGMEDGERKESSDIHPLDLRPWDITVFINLYKVHGRLPMVQQMSVRAV